MGKLYIVSTPIGNLKDITLRAIDILKQVGVILAEDTRTAQKLLAHYDLGKKRLISLYEENEETRIPEIIEILKFEDAALISESGTPLISDPGYKLVRELIAQGIIVESAPGPTAAIAALTISGLPPDKFLFLGFLPKKTGKAKKALSEFKEFKGTIIIYESPHRLTKTLQTIKEVFGDIEIVLAREITKIHEEIIREKISRVVAYFNEKRPRGEIVLLFNLKQRPTGH